MPVWSFTKNEETLSILRDGTIYMQYDPTEVGKTPGEKRHIGFDAALEWGHRNYPCNTAEGAAIVTALCYAMREQQKPSYTPPLKD